MREIVLNKLDLKWHIFGHIHEGYEMDIENETTFINASICDESYAVAKKPIGYNIE